MDYHPTVKKILSLIKENNMWHETFEHAPVVTSEEAASIRPQYSQSQGAKALIIKSTKSDKSPNYTMIVVPGDQKFSNSKVKKILNAQDIRFATPEEVSVITNGVLVGGVPPFGNLFSLTTIVDPMVLENERIIFNAGDRRFSIALYSKDYAKLVSPIVESVI